MLVRRMACRDKVRFERRGEVVRGVGWEGLVRGWGDGATEVGGGCF